MMFISSDENHQLQDERDKALQKIGNLSLGSEDMETRWDLLLPINNLISFGVNGIHIWSLRLTVHFLYRMEEVALELQASMENSKHLEKRCNELQNKVQHWPKDIYLFCHFKWNVNISWFLFSAYEGREWTEVYQVRNTSLFLISLFSFTYYILVSFACCSIKPCHNYRKYITVTDVMEYWQIYPW